MKVCKSCKAEIAVDAKKCPNCRTDQRNWFARHKILTGILVIILLAIIGSALSGGNKNSGKSGSGSSNSAKTYRFDDRADKQAKDQEIVPTESATVDGRKLTVASVERTASLSEYNKAAGGKIYVVAKVTIENTSDKTQTYNVFDFRIQTSGGQVVDPYFGGNNNLGSGDLVAGGKVTGNVTFEVPVETSNQYIIYKPNSAISDRIIVQAKQ